MSGFPRSAPTDFSRQSAPASYVPGLGRGAVGFSTRSDIGPGTGGNLVSAALAGPPPLGTLPSAPPLGRGRGRVSGPVIADAQFGAAPAGYVAGRGRAMGSLAREQGELGNEGALKGLPEQELAQGPEARAYSSSTVDPEDDEADRIYNAVDERVVSKKRKAASSTAAEPAGGRPRISDQFSDLKAGLAAVTTSEWDALPDVGDHSLKYTQKSRFSDATTAVPDSFLKGSKLGQNTALHKAAAGEDGGTKSLLAGLAAARESKLESKLDLLSGDVAGQTAVDTRGYMADLGSVAVSSDTQVGDVKRARLLLNSVTSTNPNHAPGWIAAARLEEVAGKIVAARRKAEQGCEACPQNEDVWLECARLHDGRAAQAVLAKAVQKLPHNVKIWKAASEIETDADRKKIVLRRALELVPGSAELWKAAIDLENEENAKVMLGRAVECVPQSVEMWLALVRLESHANARQVLNQMRKVHPTEPLTWITAARLEESQAVSVESVIKIVSRMLHTLSQSRVIIAREVWLEHAVACEVADAPLTCKAIIEATIGSGVAEEDKLDTWLADVDGLLEREPPGPRTAKAVLEHALVAYPRERSIWNSFISIERTHGTPEGLMKALEGAVLANPKVPVLWLMAAKHAWKGMGDDPHTAVANSRRLLERANLANPVSEDIWLAAIKLEWETEEIERARVLLRKARDEAPTARIWMKSLLLEREQQNPKGVLDLAESALNAFPDEVRLYLIAGQTAQQDVNDVKLAYKYYKLGCDHCPLNPMIWIHLSRVEDEQGHVDKARAILETARTKLRGTSREEDIWLASSRLERLHSNYQAATSLLAQGIQRLPSSGVLWAEDLLTCTKVSQKSKSRDALQKCENDAYVVLAVARLFAHDRKSDKARKWMERATLLQPKLGDAWAYLYHFELQIHANLVDRRASEEEIKRQKSVLDSIEQRCVAAEPNRGELWNATQKLTKHRRKSASFVLTKCVAEVAKAWK